MLRRWILWIIAVGILGNLLLFAAYPFFGNFWSEPAPHSVLNLHDLNIGDSSKVVSGENDGRSLEVLAAERKDASFEDLVAEGLQEEAKEQSDVVPPTPSSSLIHSPAAATTGSTATPTTSPTVTPTPTTGTTATPTTGLSADGTLTTGTTATLTTGPVATATPTTYATRTSHGVNKLNFVNDSDGLYVPSRENDKGVISSEQDSQEDATQESAASSFSSLFQASTAPSNITRLSRRRVAESIRKTWRLHAQAVREKGPCQKGKRHSTERLCDCLRSAGWYDEDGEWVSCEYRPAVSSVDALGSFIRKMRKRMKIFILPSHGMLDAPRPYYGNAGYQLEEYFYRTLSDSPQRVLRLKDANFFFLPYFSAALYDLCGHGGTGKYAAASELSTLAEQTIRHLGIHGVTPSEGERLLSRVFTLIAHDGGVNSYTQYAPKNFVYFSRFIVNSASYMAYSVSRAHRFLINKDISAVCGYHPRRQQIISARLQAENRDPNRNGTCDAERPVYAYFAGSPHTNPEVRVSMVESFNSPKYANSTIITSSLSNETTYAEALATARYCLCPAGRQKWSPRMIEAIWAGCVPVFIMDEHRLPFSCFFDWSSFSVTIPEAQAHRTADVLYSITDERYGTLCQNLMTVREHFLYHDPPNTTSLDAFTLTMLELYLRQEVCAPPAALPSLEDLRTYGM